MMIQVSFDADTHTYYGRNDPNKKFISVTTLIHKYQKPFDKEFWSLYKSLELTFGKESNDFKRCRKFLGKKSAQDIRNFIVEHERSNEIFLNQEIIKADWKQKNVEACEKGTAYHNLMEQEAINGKIQHYDGEAIPVYEFQMGLDLANLPVGFYPELRLYLYDIGLAGTSDRVWVLPGKQVIIEDWKGLSLDTEIPTKEGFKYMKDILVGDDIFDGDGKLTKVKNISEVHYNPCYKLTFDTGETVIADHEHKWVISDRNNKEYTENVYTTEQLFKSFNLKKQLRISYKPLQLEDRDLPIDPYVLGVWLGDGNRNYGTITNMNNCIWKEIEKRGYVLGDDISKGSSGKAQTKTIFGLYTKLKELNLLKNKHFPEIYSRASFNQRLDLLRGIMDADGYYNKIRDLCTMSTTQEWQKDLIVELCSSLGLKVKVFNIKVSGFGKKDIPAYSISFRSNDFSPFLNKNKEYMNIKHKPNKYNFRYIKNIEKIETVPTKCLEVESSTHTYLFSRSYIKTHNTNKELKFENKYDNMLTPLDHLQDCNFNHYQIQLSTYGFMLEQYGYTVKNLAIYHNETIYDCEYMRNEVIDMLNHYLMKEKSSYYISK